MPAIFRLTDVQHYDMRTAAMIVNGEYMSSAYDVTTNCLAREVARKSYGESTVLVLVHDYNSELGDIVVRIAYSGDKLPEQQITDWLATVVEDGSVGVSIGVVSGGFAWIAYYEYAVSA